MTRRDFEREFSASVVDGERAKKANFDGYFSHGE